MTEIPECFNCLRNDKGEFVCGGNCTQEFRENCEWANGIIENKEEPKQNQMPLRLHLKKKRMVNDMSTEECELIVNDWDNVDAMARMKELVNLTNKLKWSDSNQ